MSKTFHGERLELGDNYLAMGSWLYAQRFLLTRFWETGVAMQMSAKKRQMSAIPISAFSSTLVEKPKRGRPTTIQDNYLLGSLYQWVSLLEESWPEIGWQLLQIRRNPTSTIEDVRKAFQPVKDKPHNPGLAQAFYHDTVEAATPAEAYRNRVRQGEIQSEITRAQAKLTETELSIRDIDQALKISPPEYVETVQKEITNRKEALTRIQSEVNRLTNEERDFGRRCSDQEAYVYASELLDFLRCDGRYAVKPRSVAKALAGLPRMRWRQSYTRCSRMTLNDPRLHYQVLEVILKLWKRRQGEAKDSVIQFFKMGLLKLPKKLGYTRDFLLESWRDLRFAIEECLSEEHEEGQAPYALTSIFMRNTRNQKNQLEKVLANQEKLTTLA